MQFSMSWYGPPQVEYEGRRVIFPFRKAEALLYFLAVERRASRDRLLALLWPDMDEPSARRNLRNALYVIRKSTCDTIIATPNRDWVEWNGPETGGLDSSVLIHGEFLEGFTLKDAEPFEEWLAHQREKRREQELKLLWQKAQSAEKNGRFDECKALLDRLIQLDEYNEEAYRMLMQCWADSGQVHRALDLFQELTGLLRRELGIVPEDSTAKLYESLLKEKSRQSQEPVHEQERFFFGRERELQILRGCYRKLQGKEPLKSVLVYGEAGIGKTELLKRFLDSLPEGSLLFKTSCYATEENAYYRPWESVFQQMSGYGESLGVDTSGGFQERLLIDQLEQLSQNKPVVLFFEDIHWADPMSLHLMTRLLVQNRNQSIWLVATSRTGNWNELGSLVVEGRREELLECIELVRFTAAESREFAKNYLSEAEELFPETELFRETEGNPFFLVEYLNHWRDHRSLGPMSPRMQDVLLSRMARVGVDARKVLDLVSVFRDRVPLGVLKAISGLDEMDLIDRLDELYQADLLRESQAPDGELELFFTHQKLRDFVFDRLSEAKRRILFRRIGDTLLSIYQGSGQPRWDLLDYYYSKAGERHPALQFGLRNLDDFLKTAYETFPVLPGREPETLGSGYTEEEVGLELSRLEERLLQLEAKEGKDPCHEQRMQWLLMTARYHIKIGQYQQGLKALEELKDLAAAYRLVEWQIKAGFQEIYYCINAHRTAQMEWVVDETIQLAKEGERDLETAILYRLKGFHRILIGDFPGGESFLMQSLKRFQDFGQPVQYALNIAAVYYYLGESYRYRNQWEEARSYYEEAIRLCRSIGQEGRLTIFYTQAGHGAYESEQLEVAEQYLEESLRLYTHFDFRWGRSTALGFLSLIRYRQERYEEARELLEQAAIHAKRLGNPYEMGLVSRVVAEMRWLCRQYPNRTLPWKAMRQTAESIGAIPGEPLPDRCYAIDVVEPVSRFSQIGVSNL